jgi:hypothetical protein
LSPFQMQMVPFVNIKVLSLQTLSRKRGGELKVLPFHPFYCPAGWAENANRGGLFFLAPSVGGTQKKVISRASSVASFLLKVRVYTAPELLRNNNKPSGDL